ncbi:MAG: transporter substrate-binding domain-containing protein, partial [Spirochaetia bacterium]|nr:transporter substrate-binding domain-containing protein [Spirochaetia bacterium]
MFLWNIKTIMTGPYFKIAGLLFSLFFYFLSFQTLSAQISGRIQASSGRLKQISERGYILVGLQKDYYPFHIEGKKSRGPGIDMEIAQILAKSLGVELKVKFFNLPDLLKAVEKGDIDLSAGGISSSLERAKKNAFSEPYLVTTPGGLLSKRV